MPKCASTSISIAIKQHCNINLSGPKLKHLNAQRFTDGVVPLQKELMPNENVETFCVMRDPLEWVESWYRYRSRDQIKEPQHPHHKHYTGNICYDEFVEEYVSSPRLKAYAKIGTQYNFVSMKDGSIGLDYIFPMNKIELVSDFLSKKLKKNIIIGSKKYFTKKEINFRFKYREKIERLFS